jgi:hypothetical protein
LQFDLTQRYCCWIESYLSKHLKSFSFSVWKIWSKVFEKCLMNLIRVHLIFTSMNTQRFFIIRKVHLPIQSHRYSNGLKFSTLPDHYW